MKYLKISNNGEIEPQALHLVGASTKRTDSTKIGQFGSGNKYALAYLIRNGYLVNVWSGKNEIVIDTVQEQFRNETFNIVRINGEKTSITCSMGKNWRLWQAIREIYCNAIDEGGHSIEFVQNIQPQEGVTQFYIEVREEIMDFMKSFDDYFADNKKVLFECSEGRILSKSSATANLYRKGIRCFNSKKTSLYDYDFNEIMVNEDRIISYTWQIEEKIWRILYKCTDKEVIKNVLLNASDSNTIEGSISDVATIHTSEMSQEFKEVLQDMNIAPKGMSGLLSTEEIAKTVILPTKVFDAVRGFISEDNVSSKVSVSSSGAMFRKIEYTVQHEATLKKAIDFLNECGFEVPYTIHLAVFDSKSILGCAYKGEIFISDICMEKGVNEVVNTIIEEYIHIKYDVSDETRGFQTAIITEFISYMKAKNAYLI